MPLWPIEALRVNLAVARVFGMLLVVSTVGLTTKAEAVQRVGQIKLLIGH